MLSLRQRMAQRRHYSLKRFTFGAIMLRTLDRNEVLLPPSSVAYIRVCSRSRDSPILAMEFADVGGAHPRPSQPMW
jgi:hypothetical protein